MWDCFVVVAYGKIIPKEIIDIPAHGALNVHPSLLPHHRGPSPIESQILTDNPDDIGVSIMVLDEKMDHIQNELHVLRHLLAEEYELSDEAIRKLKRARKTPRSAYISHEDIKKMLL